MTAQRDKGVREWDDKVLGQSCSSMLVFGFQLDSLAHTYVFAILAAVDLPECNYYVSWGVYDVVTLQCQIIYTDWSSGSKI
jgi:hypothetical protein